MGNKSIYKIILTSISIFLVISPSSGIYNIGLFRDRYLPLDGDVPFLGYQKIPNMTINGACQDDALDYISCSNYQAIGHTISDVTVLVIDIGITAEFWEDAETAGWFDIVRYKTIRSEGDGGDIDLGVEGLESWSTIDDDKLGFQNNRDAGWDHGINVLSALATVARGVKVVYVTHPLYKVEDENTDYVNIVWPGVNEIIEDENGPIIDIISFSSSHNIPYNSYFASWEEKGIFMMTSAGNEGNKDNFASGDYYKYPKYYSEWYAIGSIDHETRRDPTDENVYRSYKDAFTGQANIPLNEGETYVPLDWSSWGDTWGTDSANANDFVMPGNGVPVYVYDKNLNDPPKYFWSYLAGTSFSTPYMAAAVAILIDQYMDGRAAHGGGRVKPSISTIYTILMDSSSRSIHHQYLGWGSISLTSILGFAYVAGYNSYSPPPPPPPPPGGGGCGPFPCLDP